MTSRVDHLMLVSNDVPTTVRFYADLLQGEVVRLAEFEAGDFDYPSVVFGGWQINVHPVITPTQPRARDPRPGSGVYFRDPDGCLVEFACRAGAVRTPK